jgi:hypothetical protein
MAGAAGAIIEQQVDCRNLYARRTLQPSRFRAAGLHRFVGATQYVQRIEYILCD